MAENEILKEAQARVIPDAASGLREEAHGLQKHSLLQSGIEKVASLATSDPSVQREISHYAAAGLKTGALFFGGKVGMAATVGLYGADEIDPRTGPGTMAIDGTIGMAKGAATKVLFNRIGESSLDPSVKALSLGVGSRLTETLMSRGSYFDAQGRFHPGSGLANSLSTSFDKHALGTDLVTFGLSYGAFKGVDALSGRALANSKLASTAFLGGSFGLISGANEEARNQIQTGHIDPAKIAWRGLAMGAVDAIAAIPGGLQGAAAVPKEQVPKEQVPKEQVPKDRAPQAVAKLELTQTQIDALRTAAGRRGLWLMETPNVQLAADGTPIVMPQRGTFQDAAVAVSKLATDVNHGVSLDWNGVRFRVEPGMSPSQVETAWQAASNSPERLEQLRRVDEQRRQTQQIEQQRAEQAIEALRSQPARNGLSVLQELFNESRYTGADWGATGMMRLRHPTEILDFARAYVRFHPESGVENLQSASRYAAPGTEKVWQQVARQVAGEQPIASSPAEQALFGQMRQFDTMKVAARNHDLELRSLDNDQVVVMPSGPVSIGEAGAAAGRFAGEIKRPVQLSFNERLIEVKQNATAEQVEATWRSQR